MSNRKKKKAYNFLDILTRLQESNDSMNTLLTDLDFKYYTDLQKRISIIPIKG